MKTFLAFLIFIPSVVMSQKSRVFRAHSHNDYEQKRPFYDAFERQFGSIEADIYLKNGALYVAHEYKYIDTNRTFKKLYLDPIVAISKKNQGYKYKNGHGIQLLIDLKTGGETLKKLEELLLPYKTLFDVQTNALAIRLVISGNMPSPEEFLTFDPIFFFDGRQNIIYSPENLKRVGLISVSFSNFGTWNGTTALPDSTKNKLLEFVNQWHEKGLKVRFWGMPNTHLSYQTQQEIGSDFIGSDDLEGLENYLKSNQ